MNRFSFSFGIILLLFAALVGIQSGIRFLLIEEFQGYHEGVCGTSWRELSVGMRTMIVGLLKIIGGGFLAFGLMLTWLIRPVAKSEAWARWCVFMISIAMWGPTLYVALWFRSAAPMSNPPILQVSLMLLFPIVGLVFSYRPPSFATIK